MTAAGNERSLPAAATLPEAGLLRRCSALIYEGMLVFALLLAAGFAVLPVIAPPGSGPYAASRLYLLPPASSAFLCVYYLVIAGVYCILFWSNGRRTLPMKTWGLRLVAADGSPVDRKLASKRYFAAWIGPLAGFAGFALAGRWGLVAGALNYLWAIVDRDRRFLHDRIAGTRLVRSLAG